MVSRSKTKRSMIYLCLIVWLYLFPHLSWSTDSIDDVAVPAGQSDGFKADAGKQRNKLDILLLRCLDATFFIMMTVVVILNVMVFCVMMDMVVVGGGNLPTGNLPLGNSPEPDKHCDSYDELELAKGERKCPLGRPREYSIIQSVVVQYLITNVGITSQV